MQINYEDERLQEVENQKNSALQEVESTYEGMIGQAGEFYQQQIDAAKDFTDQQSQIQQEQTDFAIEQLEQQKEQAQKDYTKEQSAAYTDWKRQSSMHGINAEQMAQAGMTGSGFSESSQVAMYNAYQQRVAVARESITQAVVQYDNAMKEARLQNNAVMAEIAFQGFQQALALGLEGFQYENQLLQQLIAQKANVEATYHGRYQDVLAQINSEAALAEQIRQYNESMAMQQKEHDEGVRRFNEELAEEIRQFNLQMGITDTGSTGNQNTPGTAGSVEDIGIIDNANPNTNAGADQFITGDAGQKNPQNYGFDDETVKLAQQFVGADADGIWGPKSKAAAAKKGFDHLVDVVNALKEQDHRTAGSTGGTMTQSREKDIATWVMTALENKNNSSSFDIMKLINGTSFLKTEAERNCAIEVAKIYAGIS